MHGVKGLEEQNSRAFVIHEIVRSHFSFSSESSILLVLMSLLTFTFLVSQEETFFHFQIEDVRPQMREQ